MGLNAKQAGLYIKKSNAYQINSAIRKKLGLGPNETNLNLYITRISAQDAD